MSNPDVTELRDVLIIDDDPNFHRNLIRSTFFYRHFNFASAHEASVGLNLIQEKSFDLCLLDLYLSSDRDLDGLDLLAKIKKEFPSLPVIVVSEEEKDEVLIKAMRLGAKYYLKKSNFDRYTWSKLFIEIIEEKAKPRILIIDDDETFHLNLQRSMRRNFIFNSVYTLEGAQNIMRNSIFDLVLLDLKFNNGVLQENGIEFYQKYLSKGPGPFIPVIVVSNEINEETIFQLGRQNLKFLSKSEYDRKIWQEEFFSHIQKFKQPKIFISHSHKDKERGVLELYDRLKNSNTQPWLDREELEPGDELSEEILNGIYQCDVFVLVLSNTNTQNGKLVSKWLLEEYEFAHRLHKIGHIKKIIFVFLDSDRKLESPFIEDRFGNRVIPSSKQYNVSLYREKNEAEEEARERAYSEIMTSIKNSL